MPFSYTCGLLESTANGLQRQVGHGRRYPHSARPEALSDQEANLAELRRAIEVLRAQGRGEGLLAAGHLPTPPPDWFSPAEDEFMVEAVMHAIDEMGAG